MAKSKREKDVLRQEKAWKEVDEVVIESTSFLEKNFKTITIVVGAVLLVAGAYFAFEYFYMKPKNKAAQVAMFKAEEHFRNGQDSLAIYGDGNSSVGFMSIIDDYGSTPAGDLAGLYVGISYTKLGQYEKALSYLKAYNGKDEIVSHLLNSAIGDCLVGTGKQDEAISYFIKAAQDVDNAAQSPVLYKKAAEIYRAQGNHDKVIELYTLIKNNYANSSIAAVEADKYIEEAKMLKAGN